MILKYLMAAFLGFAALLAPTGASAAECTLYEQAHPAFPLSGAHLSAGKCNTCASCHRSGVFLGTPRTCVACHNGDPLRVTVGRSINHIPTSLLDCDSCHNTASFTASWTMNHTTVAGQRCDTCHNGSYLAYNALDKAAKQDHLPTTADCNACHQSTTTFDSVDHAGIHAGITTGCVTCHDNKYAPGKASYAAGHPLTSDQCETCHSINNEFKCATAFDKLVNFAQLTLRNAVYSLKRSFV